MKKSAAHPLAREVHFHVILMSLRILAYSTGSGERTKWQLKDQILSAGLAWFSHTPRWSFGSNKLQIKAEVQLMDDVLTALQFTSAIGTKPTLHCQSLQSKQELLTYLLVSEVTRLGVWIAPLGESTSPAAKPSVAENVISPLLKTAWMEDASLAVQIAIRSHSPRIQGEVRKFLVNCPEKALGEPEALPLLLPGNLPADLSFQLKVSFLMTWSCSTLLTRPVSFILGSNQPHLGRDLFPACIRKPSFRDSICNASFGEPLGGRHILLRSSDRADSSLRCSRIRGALHR